MTMPLERFMQLHRENYFKAYMVTELAQYVGVSRMTVHRWLKGLYKPSEKQNEKIEKFIIMQGEHD